MKVRSVVLPIAAAAITVTAACGPATTQHTRYDCSTGAANVQLKNIFDTAGIFSLNNGPPSGPSGVNTCIPAPVRAIPGAFFDFAVTINGTNAFLLPPKTVSAAGAAGWISSTQAFVDVATAPTFGYNDSVPLAIAPGSVFLIQALSRGCAQLPYQTQRYVYSKFVIDSIHYYPYNAVTQPSGLVVYYRMVTDPTCGYVTLTAGIPPN